jgi:hypothetical protein
MLCLLWPAGIVQSAGCQTGRLRKDSGADRSGPLPLLYAWNGTEYSFVTDFLRMRNRLPEEPGRWSYPIPTNMCASPEIS